MVDYQIAEICPDLWTLRTVFGFLLASMQPAHSVFFGNFGSEIQIGNQQVLGQNWVKKVVINKFSLGKK